MVGRKGQKCSAEVSRRKENQCIGDRDVGIVMCMGSKGWL